MKVRPITILHISDIQFGKDHRFDRQAEQSPLEALGTLLERLLADIRTLRRSETLEPDLLFVTGDLAEWGRKPEFAEALHFLRELSGSLGLRPDRVTLIPGNHDINWPACEAYFKECQSEELQPAFPYWPKWKHYVWMFQQFYGDTAGAEFTEEQPWSFFEFPDLRVVVAGINSTMAESHRTEDHHGHVGERQLLWFQNRLEPYRSKGWLRIGLVHHNYRRGATSDNENLRDADDLERLLGESLNLLFHGHTHDGRLDWMSPSVPILSTGSAAVTAGARPPEVPNQYQFVRIWPDHIQRGARGYAPDRKTWIGDNRVSRKGDSWKSLHKVSLDAVAGTFPVPRGSKRVWDVRAEIPERSKAERKDRPAGSGEGLLNLVETICRLREPDALVERIPGTGAIGDYLRVSSRIGDITRVHPLGVVERDVSPDALQAFLSEVDSRYRRSDPGLVSTLVYGGEPAPESLHREATKCRVRLLSFLEYQGLIDFRAYVVGQTLRLAADPIYPSWLYVPQRLRFDLGRGPEETQDAADTILEWLSSPHGRFILILGDFGTGKTFLLHELAQRIADARTGLIPILLQMRSLEKGRSLDELLAQQFVRHGMDDFVPRKFRYMLEQGRIALLFDGFDELALRVTYPRAAEHFDTLLQAAAGSAKVVVTSRRQHFLTDRQAANALGERVESLLGSRIVLLQSFNPEQIRGFLVRYCGGEEQAKARLLLIDRVKDLMGLSQNPRMLGFIAELPEEDLRKAGVGQGEITSAVLYRMILERWLRDEAQRIRPKGAPPGLSEEDRWKAVTALALRLWQKTESVVGLADLTEDAAKVLETLSAASIDPDTAAFQVGSGTLLVRDSDGYFSFLHQSVLEWLVARQAAEELESDATPQSLSVRELSPLMADFLISLAGRDATLRWVRRTLVAASADFAKRNALLLAQRMSDGEAEELLVAEPAKLMRQDLRGKDLSGQDLNDADLRWADLSDAVLVQTRLRGAQMTRSKLVGAHLLGADLSGADLSHADLTSARLLGSDLRGADLSGAVLRRAKLLGAQWDDKALVSADVFGAALQVQAHVPALSISPSNSCESTAWNRDGSLLATTNGSSIHLWDMTTGKELRRLEGHREWIRSADFSPDGRLLASGADDLTVRLWDVMTAAELAQLNGHGGRIRTVSFSPDGRTLASGSEDRTICLWDTARAVPLLRMTGHEGRVSAVSFSPDGKRLASGSNDSTIRLWDVEAGYELRTIEAHSSRVNCISFSPDGHFIASGSDDTICIHDLRTGRLWAQLLTDSRVLSLVFTPDGRTLAAGSGNSVLRLWEVTNGRETKRSEILSDMAHSASFSPDGKHLAVSSHHPVVRVWDIETGLEFRRLESHYAAGVRSVSFSQDGRLLASASEDGAVRVWDAKTGLRLRILERHDRALLGLCFGPQDGLIASSSEDGEIAVWSFETGTKLKSLRPAEKSITNLVLSPDGHKLIGATADSTILWDLRSDRQTKIHGGGCLALSPREPVLANCTNVRSIALNDAETGKLLRPSFTGHVAQVSSLDFNADGKLLVSGSHDQTARLWEVASGRELRRLEGHGHWVLAVSFSPDGLYVASGGSDGTVILWETTTGFELRRLKGHASQVWSVRFSPDGRFLASGSADNTVRLWNVQTGRCLAILANLPTGWVAFAPDGRYKLHGSAAAGFWHVVNLCRFDPGELDDYVPGLRLEDNASFWDLPEWRADEPAERG